MVRVGLIGFGMAARDFHAPLIGVVPGLELSCILDRGGVRAQQKYPHVRMARSLDELLNDEQIDLCVIATPNSSHFDLARRCLLAGRNVVVDKPFTTSVSEAEQLITLSEQQQRLLTAFQNRRWDGDFLTVKKLIASGRLGRVVSYESNYDRFRPAVRAGSWRETATAGAGMLLDLGSHSVDQLLHLFGRPDTITADIFLERDQAVVDDAFFIRFDYPRMHAILRSNMLVCAPGPRFVVHGTDGSYVKHGVDAQEHALRDGRLPAGDTWGENPESEWGTLSRYRAGIIETEKVKTEPGDYRCFYANIREVLREGAPLAVKPREALDTMRALELAMQSSRDRRTVPWRNA